MEWEHPTEDDMEWLNREKVKSNLRRCFVQGNAMEILNHIGNYGKYSWSNSELDEIICYKVFTSSEYGTLITKVLIENIKLDKNSRTINSIYQTAKDAKNEKLISYIEGIRK